MKPPTSLFTCLLAGMLLWPASSHAFPDISTYLDSSSRIPFKIIAVVILAVGTAGIFWVLSKLFGLLQTLPPKWAGKRYHSFTFRSHVLLTEQQITALLTSILRGIRLLFSLGVLFAFMNYAFILFPLRIYAGVYSVVRSIFLVLVVTVLYVLFLRALRALFRHSLDHVRSWKGTLIRDISFKSIRIFSDDQILSFLIIGFKIVRMGLYLSISYVYVIIVFSFFGATKTWSSVLFSFLMTPLRMMGLSFIHFLPNLFVILVFSGISYYFIKIVRLVFVELERGTIVIPGFYPEWSMPTHKLVSLLIIFFTLIVIFPYIPGSSSPGFRGLSVFIGVLLSFGSTSAISNVVAGVVITYMRPFKIGDRVRIADTTGDVIEKSLLVSRIRTIKNEDITIPNAMILGSHIVNYSSSAHERGLILHTSVTIGYDTPWRTVHELLISAARSTQGILPSSEPFVLQKSLDDFYVSYELNAYTDQPNRMASVYSELHQNIQDAFFHAGVEIMSPHYGALRDGNKTAIPDENLPQSYSIPGFRIDSPPSSGSSGE